MSFLFSAIKYSLIILFVPIFLLYFYKLAKLVGVKEYSKEEIQQFRINRYPTYYNYVYFSLIGWLFIAGIIAAFIVCISIFSWLPKLSQMLFVDGETLLFRSISGWIDAIVFLYLFISTFTILYIVPICVVLFILKDFDAFCIVLHSNNRSTNSEVGKIARLKYEPISFLIIILGLVLVTIPLIALKVNSYTKIADEKITINKFIGIKGKYYSWNEAKYVKLYGRYNRRHRYSSIHFELEMQDSDNIILWTSDNFQKGFIVPSKEELKDFIEKVKTKNIQINIQDNYHDYLKMESDEWDRERGIYIYEKLTRN